MKKVKKEMTSLSSESQVEGEENVNWSFYDDYRVIKNVKIKACYTPSRTVRVFSPQHYFKQEKSTSFRMNNKGHVIMFASGKN